MKYYVGGVSATATHIGTLTVSGTWETDDIVDFVVSNENYGTKTTLSVTVTSTTISTICTNLAAAWNASTSYLLTPVTAAGGATTVTFTGDTTGIRHYITPSTRDVGGVADSQSVSYTSGPSNISPWDFKSPDNWLDRTFPSDGDDIDLATLIAAPISYGLVNSLAPASVLIGAPTYAIGTTTAPLRLGTPTGQVIIGSLLADGTAGSPTSVINLSAPAGTLDMRGSATQGSGGFPPVMIGGGTWTINQTGGILGVNLTPTPGETTTLAASTSLSGGTFIAGAGLTWTGNITNTGATASFAAGGPAGTLTSSGGTTTIDGVLKLGTWTANEGTLYFNARLSGNEIDTLALGSNTSSSKVRLALGQDLDGMTIGTLTPGSSFSNFTIERNASQGVTISNVGSLSIPTGKTKLTIAAS